MGRKGKNCHFPILFVISCDTVILTHILLSSVKIVCIIISAYICRIPPHKTRTFVKYVAHSFLYCQIYIHRYSPMLINYYNMYCIIHSFLGGVLLEYPVK